MKKTFFMDNVNHGFTEIDIDFKNLPFQENEDET